MSQYTLHCFALSGSSYKVALFFALAGLKWEPIFVDYLGGETRSVRYRAEVNEQGEAPVLVHGNRKLSQSAVILDYLVEQTGQFGGDNQEERREIWRWMLFDNHKFTSYYATLRFLYAIQKQGDSEVIEFLRQRARMAYQIVDDHLARTDFMIGSRATIADISLAGYVFMPEETGLDLRAYANIEAWKMRLRSLPGWKHPYDLMPGPTPPFQDKVALF